MADDPMNDAFSATFLFEVDGVDIGAFQEVSGLEVSIETEDVPEGGQNSFTHKLPGRMSWPNITLKRGVTRQDSLLKWLNESSGESFAANGNKLVRKTAAITLVDRTGKRLRSWNFTDAYPVKWTGPSFAATSTDAANEELEITHHGFRANDL
jgi:phage tail-like protein